MKFRYIFAALVAGLTMVQMVTAADWITAPSYYTHDPQTGQRVTQYTPIGPFYTFARVDYSRSGFRHTRSSIQAGNSADHMHIVEEWGRPIRPYGEWRFPYRPYSVPYAGWGAPFAGLNQPGWWGPSVAAPLGGGPGNGPGFEQNPYGRQQPPPYYDGNYPLYRTRPPTPWPSSPGGARGGGSGRGGHGGGGHGGGGHGGGGHGGGGHTPGSPGGGPGGSGHGSGSGHGGGSA